MERKQAPADLLTLSFTANDPGLGLDRVLLQASERAVPVLVLDETVQLSRSLIVVDLGVVLGILTVAVVGSGAARSNRVAVAKLRVIAAQRGGISVRERISLIHWSRRALEFHGRW